MKWPQSIISGTNLYLKLAIFVTGLVTGLDSSARQLLAQIVLSIAYLLMEPGLLRLLVKALRRILPFLTGYWLFATIFSQSFPASVFFSLQVLYLLIITVVMFGNVHLSQIASDSLTLRKFRPLGYLFYYLAATSLYMKAFLSHYRQQQSLGANQLILSVVSSVLHNVSQGTPLIREQVRLLTDQQPHTPEIRPLANLCGIVFLAVLVIAHSL